MRLRGMLRTGAAIGAVALAVTACGGGGGNESLVQRAKDNGKLVVGIKYDQPGLGLQTPNGFEGFDVDVAKYVAKELGVDPKKIEFKEAQSSERENLLKKGDVDYIVATYSITDKRKKAVSFAGPYFVAGQGLLVRKDNKDITGPESLNGKKLCSVSGSTPAQTVKEKFANRVQLQEYGKYSDCITALEGGKIDAVTTDDVILAGYAAQNKGRFKLVGKPFTTERYGIGLEKGDTEAVNKINDAIKKMEESGAWLASLKEYVGPSGYKIPSPPKPGSDGS